jgi:putative hemolysin
MVRCGTILLSGLLALTGCGDPSGPTASRTPAPSATPAAKPAAPALVFCQRQGEGGATLDAITVRSDGTATLEKRHGGAGGRFKEQVLRKGVLPKLRRALARLPAGSSLTRGSPPPGGTQFILRYRGRTQTAREGGIVPRARAAVKLLDGLINGVGIRQTTRDRATHTY